MGSGVAVAFALAGIDVVCLTRSESSRAALEERVAAAVDVQTRAGLIDEFAAARAARRITYVSSIAEAVREADVVVESVAEDVPLKQEVLAEIAEHAPRTAIITTNTSSLSLEQLQHVVPQPERFAGLHWFLPAELVEVVEVVRAPATSDATVGVLLALGETIGKKCIEVHVPVPGFVVNRLQYALLREAHSLVAGGVCSADDVDLALTHALGPRWCAVGPLLSMDLAGLDVHLAVARQLFPELSVDIEPPARVAEAVLRGDLGAKSGRGLHGEYDSSRLGDLTDRRAAVIAGLRASRTEDR